MVRRERTNTPLQALVTLNDVTYLEAARALAQRTLLSTSATSDDERLTEMFRRCTARAPRAEELQLLTRRLVRLRDHYGREPQAATELIAAGESKADSTLVPAELAAWTGLGSLLLNLDETLTKE